MYNFKKEFIETIVIMITCLIFNYERHKPHIHATLHLQ